MFFVNVGMKKGEINFIFGNHSYNSLNWLRLSFELIVIHGLWRNVFSFQKFFCLFPEVLLFIEVIILCFTHKDCLKWKEYEEAKIKKLGEVSAREL